MTKSPARHPAPRLRAPLPLVMPPDTMAELAAANPLVLWSEVLRKTCEMLWSSQQVIGARVGRMVRAGPNPSRRDQREFSRMGLEKIEATAASALAVGTQLQAAQLAWAAPTLAWWLANWQSLLGARPAPAHPCGVRLSHKQISTDLARLADAALEPIHATATANARRLTRARKGR